MPTQGSLAEALMVFREILRDILIIMACARYLGWW